jgi:hypothetical protein
VLRRAFYLLSSKQPNMIAPMTLAYRVVDLRDDAKLAGDIIIEGARTPEDAAREALGLRLIRSGSKRDLAARVYWQHSGQPLNMVRLYTKVTDR